MPARRFTDEEEIEIGKIYRSGISAREIARTYGLSHHIAVTSALRRTTTRIRPNTEANRLYTINHKAFDEFTEQSVYWWGFIYADGAISRHKSLSIGLKETDIDHMIALSRFLKSNAPVKIRETNLKPHKAAYLYVTSQHMGTRLEELGIIAKRPAFDRILKYLPKELTHHWLRGLFDGDGSVRAEIEHNAPGLGFCGKRPLMEFIRTYLAEHAGTNPKLKIYQHQTGLCYLRYCGRRQSVRIADVLYEDATIWLKRKHDVIESWPKPQIRERNSLGQFI